MLEHPTTERSFAVIGDAYSAGLPLVSRLEGGNIQSYLTVDECIKAVSTGKATDAVLITYTAQEIINNSYKKRFSTTILSDTSSEITCAVNKDSDIRLFSILSKSLESISDDEKREIIAAYTLDYSYTYTLTDFFFRYPIQSIIIIAAVFLLACGSLYLSSRISIAKRDLVISNSSARFGAMIYDSYDAVSEAELNTNTIYSMSFEDSKLEHKKIAMKIDESIRYALDHLVHPDDAKAFAEFFSTEAMKQHSLAPSRESLEIRMRENTSSEYHWNMLTAVGMAHDEAHSGSILILRRDIQNLKQLEEEKRRQLYDALAVAELANSAKTSFMSKMSHEIRTPLNAITSYMAIAKKSVSNPTKVTDCLTKAEFASKHLLSLINDVLDMSAIERGKLNINSGSFDFRLLITQLSAMFHSQSRQKNVRFETILNGISTERLIGDQMRLNQVLINLLSNAVKFTPSGGKIILEITQTSISEESVHLRFAVIDTGVGMSEDFMARIFKPFEQQDASISQNYGGTGLGLSICKNLITLMDGAIQVKSRMGEGTTFTVDLPFIRDSKSTLPSFASFGDICALVVDDDPESCEYTAMLMQTCGITSEYVLSGAEAIEKFRGKLFDLCIIDWKMPEMDGVETIRRLRDEHGIKVPIIVVSSYDYSEIQNAATAAGANFFATKPLFRSTVVDLLMNIYGRYDTKSSADDEKVDFRGKHILLADDNELNLEVATELLEDSGFIVDGARNGKEALDKFLSSEEEQYDLILLDVQMPIMDGHEACRRIRSSSHKRAKAIPIIAMTANAFTEDISAALSAGMNNHVAKPIDLPALLDMLKQYLGYDDADESNYSDE